MKQLMIGNAAVARGAYEAGVRVVSSYPGTPSTEITEVMSTFPAEDVYVEWAPMKRSRQKLPSAHPSVVQEP